MGYTVPNRGQSRSPVKEVAARLNPVESDFARRIPSRTFVRTSQPTDILDFPVHRHPRISLDLQLGASLFVGGGSIEGNVRIAIDDAERVRHKRSLAIARISVDLLGVEEMSGVKRSIFLNLATELIDSENPPPHRMVESTSQISPIDPFWHLVPNSTSLPFSLSLPLDIGPPPFQSKHARIRTTQEVSVLSVYDPEKALTSLPSPLTASDEYQKARETCTETIKVTAGLHRQVWVSGTTIFVDIHIANHSRKTVRKIELQLERDILFYKHAAASTIEKSASQARIFDSNERSTLTRNTIKAGTTHCWNGVAAHSSELRTCDLELPRGHATVKCGKYFEVRYFLNIIVSSAHTKLVTVQLPIVLIHMNSLDVVPNSVAQVAAAIEEKRTALLHAQTYDQDEGSRRLASKSKPLPHAPPSQQQSPHSLYRRPSLSVQGRAFAAPRKQSLDRMRAHQDDLAALTNLVQSSPRRFYSPPKSKAPHQQQRREPQQREHTHRETSNQPSVPHQVRRTQSSYDYRTPPSNRKGRLLEGESVEDFKARLRRMGSSASNRTHGSVRTAYTNRTNKSALRGLGLGLGLGVGRGASLRSKASRRPGVASALGFREAEVDVDVEERGGTGGKGKLQQRPESAASFRSKLEQARNRQWEFQIGKKKSGERWKGVGVGWLRGREAEERGSEGGGWF
ncbi:hypothetical protein W97_02726 [Coniosporium apollinis CBS 100218]|uniref:Arrestin C-terminal-like domain-containing protein n=1 Tax=Coniosporium apollinis (strain CBS 100218) TaxID=1168221 RepID=R7YNR0_CONA1|nr:uncharacterized protein W97_02726 [Coniosporium apollinis CBS 100218]EON63498.1 hypothetical protein W97_02726 [Coniosporium apollinis CBS 100218]